MSELFLIAHKVRGEAAFDVAAQMECPVCNGQCKHTPEWPCVECDSTGYWWIIPTSGHRAYPYWHHDMNDLLLYYEDEGGSNRSRSLKEIRSMLPNDLPDHYQSRAEPSRLAQLKAMLPPAKPIHRRF